MQIKHLPFYLEFTLIYKRNAKYFMLFKTACRSIYLVFVS